MLRTEGGGIATSDEQRAMRGDGGECGNSAGRT